MMGANPAGASSTTSLHRSGRRSASTCTGKGCQGEWGARDQSSECEGRGVLTFCTSPLSPFRKATCIMQWCVCVCVLIVHGCGPYCLAAMWTSHAVVAAAVALAAALCSVCIAAPTPVIFDTDIGTDFGEGRGRRSRTNPPLTVSCMVCAMACSQHARPFGSLWPCSVGQSGCTCGAGSPQPMASATRCSQRNVASPSRTMHSSNTGGNLIGVALAPTPLGECA